MRPPRIPAPIADVVWPRHSPPRRPRFQWLHWPGTVLAGVLLGIARHPVTWVAGGVLLALTLWGALAVIVYEQQVADWANSPPPPGADDGGLS